MSLGSIRIVAALLVVVIVLQRFLRKNEPVKNAPPMVHVAEDDLIYSPIESMTKALRENGPVVGVERNGNVEYLVSKEYTRRLLTDESAFSFEVGVAKVLGLDFVFNLHGGSFLRDMDSLVKNYLARRLNEIVPEIWPIFERGADKMVKDGVLRPVDILPYARQTMGQVSIRIFLGESYDNPRNVNSVVDIAEDIAELSGIFKNTSYLRNFPLLWRMVTWIKLLFRIPYHIGPRLFWEMWTDVSRPRKSKSEDNTIVTYLVNEYADENGYISVTSRLWMIVLLLGIIFVSLHQTITNILWVTCFLAKHNDSQDRIRDEARRFNNDAHDQDIAFKALQKSAITDSYVREVMRMKGDTASLARATIRDAQLGPYMIPKGSIVIPVTYLSYRSPDFHPNPQEFNPLRWVGSGRSAATTGPGYLVFGLGRWSCPGRVLAANEIKLWLMALVKCGRFKLQGDKYMVPDPHNVTSVPPIGRLMFDEMM